MKKHLTLPPFAFLLFTILFFIIPNTQAQTIVVPSRTFGTALPTSPNFTATNGTQTGNRLLRTEMNPGTTSVCGVDKPNPGTFGPSTNRRFEKYRFTATASGCLTINFTQSNNEAFFCILYSVYDPTASSSGHLADFGTVPVNQNFGYQVVMGQTYDLVVSEFANNSANRGNTNSKYSINATFSHVTNITSAQTDGNYEAGSNLDITVGFNATVTVTGTPQLILNSTPTNRVANYLSGSGTNTLTFRYAVQPNDLSADLDYVNTTSLVLNGGTIRNGTADSDLTLPTPNVNGSIGNSLGFNKNIALNIIPTVTSIVRPNLITATTTNNSVVYRVTFSEAVNNVGTNDFSLTNTGTASGTVASVTPISSTVYDVTVNSITGVGTLRLDVPVTATVNDLVGNTLVTTFTTGETYTFSAPITNNIIRQDPPTTIAINNISVVFRATFDRTVKNVDINDFVLTKTGTANGTIASVSATTGMSIDITVNNITGGGTLQLAIPLVNTINDDLANITSAFTTGEIYTIDRVPPVVASIVRQTPTTAAVINNASVVYRVTFSKGVNNVDVNDFALVATESVLGTIATVNPVSALVYDVTANAITGGGTLRLDLPNTATVNDILGNVLVAAFTTGEVYTIDRIPPVVTSIIRQNPTTAAVTTNTVVYRVIFSEPVTGVATNDFALTGSGNVKGTVAAVTPNSATEYDVTVNAITGAGSLRLDVPAIATINDALGNTFVTAFTTGASYNFSAPTAGSIVRQNPMTASPINNTTVVFRVSFDRIVKDVDITDFILTSTGTVNGTIVLVSATTGSVIDVTVNNISGSGTLRLDIPLANTINDNLANITGAFNTGEVYTFDNTPPVITNITRRSPASILTNLSSVSFDVTFSENVNNIDVSDFVLNTTGTAAGTIASVSSSTGNTVFVTINGISGSGNLRLDVPNTATINDMLGNALNTAFTNGQIYTIDRVPPTVTSIVRQNPASAIVLTTFVTYRVTFSEEVNNVGLNDFVLSRSGTVSGIIDNVSPQSATEYDVTVNGITGAGSLRLDVPATATVNDVIGNALNTPFNTGDSYNFSAPTATSIIRQNPTAATTITNASVVFRATFSRSVKDVDITDFILTRTGTVAGTISSVSASTGSIIDITVNGINGTGTLRLDIPLINTINDDLANITGAFNTGEVYTFDRTAPTITNITRRPAGTPMLTNATSVSFDVTFSKNVNNIDINDFVLNTTGSATGTIASVSANTGNTVFVTINGISGAGNLRLDVPNTATINDLLGNPLSMAFITGQAYTIDRVAPTVTSIVRKNPLFATTEATEVTFQVNFSKLVNNITSNSFVAVGIGTVISVSANSGSSVEVRVAVNQDLIGTVRLDVPAGSGITDAAGNALGTFNKGETYNNILIPGSPADVKAKAASKQVTLSWDAVLFATNYEIYMYSANQPQRLVGNVNSNTNIITFTVTGLDNGTTYFFRIKAISRQGESDFSVAVSARPSIILGTEEETLNSLLKVYPNPSNGNFTLQIDEVKSRNMEIYITDMSGREVYKQSLQPNGRLDMQLNLNLASGMYLLQVSTEKENLKRKLVIER